MTNLIYLDNFLVAILNRYSVMSYKELYNQALEFGLIGDDEEYTKIELHQIIDDFEEENRQNERELRNSHFSSVVC